MSSAPAVPVRVLEGDLASGSVLEVFHNPRFESLFAPSQVCFVLFPISLLFVATCFCFVVVVCLLLICSVSGLFCFVSYFSFLCCNLLLFCRCCLFVAH